MLINEEFNNIIKILVVGDYAVGKTNFILQFVEHQFYESVPITTSCDIKSKIIQVKNKQIKLQLWDTCGQEKFRSVTKSLFAKADGIILIFDITNYSSFVNLSQWLDLISETCGDANVIIVGNKVDLFTIRCVSETTATKFANVYNFKYREVCAKTGFGIKETIHELLESILEITDSSFMGLSLNQSTNVGHRSCCTKK